MFTAVLEAVSTNGTASVNNDFSVSIVCLPPASSRLASISFDNSVSDNLTLTNRVRLKFGSVVTETVKSPSE